MKLHNPERFEAHRGRSTEHLLHIAKLMNCASIDEAEQRNWTMEIEDNVPPPAGEEAPKRKRGRPAGAASKPKTPSQAEVLEAALKFVSPVNSDLHDYSQYVSLTANTAVMYNGQIAAGHPIIEELTVSPHLEKLIAALKRCGKTLVIAETENGQLSIKGDKLRALVPCFEYTGQMIGPDLPVVGDYEILKEAFKVCGVLASENGERVVEASILLDPYSATGTNGHAMLQFYHGLANVPPGTVLPKAFCAAVAACPKPITGIGADWDAEAGFAKSFTVWFEGGAWYKTQCYHDRWPDISGILNVNTAPVATYPGLFDAVEAVTHFIDEAKSKAIHFQEGFVSSHKITLADEKVGAQYEVKDLPGGKTFNGKMLKQIAPYCETIDLTTAEDRAYFFSNKGAPVRGVVMGMRA